MLLKLLRDPVLAETLRHARDADGARACWCGRVYAWMCVGRVRACLRVRLCVYSARACAWDRECRADGDPLRERHRPQAPRRIPRQGARRVRSNTAPPPPHTHFI